MIALRRSTVLAHARTSPIQARPLALVRVGGDSPTWSYTDRNDKVWTFEDRADTVPAGQRFVGSTDQYPESTFKFYEATNDELIATVENLAKSQAPSGATSSAYSVGGTDDAGAADLASFSSTVESEEGPIVEQDTTSRLMADEGITYDAAVTKQVQKKAATAVPKSPPTAAGVVALKAVQTLLMKLGYDLGAKYGADGKIGPFTRAAITKFKKDQGLTPTDSTINPAFLAALNEAAGGGKPASVPSETVAAAAGGIGKKTGIVVAIVAAVTAVIAVSVYLITRKP